MPQFVDTSHLGHTRVVLKRHAESLLDLTPDEAAAALAGQA
jgi:diadenosine tetraphosphate (Ap4A) HIT family hydrolase